MAEPGQIAYEAYCEAVGGVSAISGDPLPSWDDQCANQPLIANAWRAAALAVMNRVDR